MTAGPDGTARFGLSCALATPFLEDGTCDCPTLVEHARSRLQTGCSSVTLFGTTGEGASVGAAQRRAIQAAFRDAGFDMAEEVVVGVCAPAAADAVAQIREGASFGVRRFLVPPPFYFKNLRGTGLYDWFRRVLRATAGVNARLILYHIPSVTSVPLPIEMIERLAAEFPGQVYGVKDSSGDWEYSERLLSLCGRLAVLIGDERHLARAVGLGAEGAISGTANIFPELLVPLVEDGREDARVNHTIDQILRFPVTPAVKILLAHRTGNPGWRRVAPPLVPLSDDEADSLIASFEDILAAH
jgi:4-hydroxy-tetrahydrodipicolinate synthase